MLAKTITTDNNHNKRFLEKNIKKLTTEDYSEILNIIRNNNEKYTENTRGVYFNLNYINETTINKLVDFVKTTTNSDLISHSDNSSITYNIDNINSVNIPREHQDYRGKLKEVSYDIHKLINDKVNKSQKFSFQNFLQKISVSNIKSFEKTVEIEYPELKIEQNNFQNMNKNLYKKCKHKHEYFKTDSNYKIDNANITLINTLDLIDLNNI